MDRWPFSQTSSSLAPSRVLDAAGPALLDGRGIPLAKPVKFVRLLHLVLELATAVVKSAVIIVKSTYHSVFRPKGKSLEGEVVLVTGAGHGIGRQLALQFAEHGCWVACVDINEVTNQATARDINARHQRNSELGTQPVARAYTCDVTDRNRVLEMATRVQAELGRVDVLVNNAGIMPVHSMLQARPGEVVDVINVNLVSHFWTILAFLPGMVQRNHGHVVAISSMAGLCGLANKVPYSASKFAVAGLMDALSEELRLDARAIKVTCVHPYFIHTRPDLPEDLDLRIPELSPEFAASEIITAVRQEEATITVPRNLLFWLNVMRALPQDARTVWRDLFHTRVTPTVTQQSQPEAAKT